MSLGSLQYQQQLQQQHPLLAASSGNNYALNGQSRGHQHMHQQHLHQPHHHMFRPMAAGTSMQGVYTSSGHSGYGAEPSDGYEYGGGGHPVHVPSGGSNSYHATAAGTGYGPPAPPAHQPHPPHHPPHPPAHAPQQQHHHHHQPHPQTYQHSAPTAPSADIDKKKQRFGGSSSLTALTLLAFFFFVNILQTSLKEHMDSVNPTVMVMTAGGVRNRFNKLAEMNSREQSSSPASATAFSSGANIVIQPADLVAAASAGVAVPAPTVKLQSPYSNSGGGNNKQPASHYNSNKNTYNNQQQQQQPQQQQQQHSAPFSSSNHDPHPEFYDSAHSYPNRTSTYSNKNNNNNYNNHHHHYQHQHQSTQEGQQLDAEDSPHRPSHHHHQHYTHASDAYPWSYDGAAAASSSSAASYRRGGSSVSAASSSQSLPPSSSYAHVGGSNYFDNDDRYGDSYYTRIN